MKRSKSTEARQQQAIEQKSALLKNVETADFLKIQPLTYRTDVLASFSDVSVIYDDRPVFQPMSFEIRRRERIFLDGKNGCGKSSLLKLLSEYAPEHTGTVTIGSGLVISLRTARHLTFGRNTVSICRKTIIWYESLISKQFCRKIGFRNACSSKKNISDFSGRTEEKSSSSQKSLCEQAHLYVWDEPLNFIDVYSACRLNSS